MNKRILSVVFVFCMILSFAVVKNDTVNAADSKKPKLSTLGIILTQGRSKKISLKNYAKLSKKQIKKVKWSSGNKKIAAVKCSGKYHQNAKVTAKNPGTCTVSLRYNGKTYHCKITVKPQEEAPDTGENISEGTDAAACIHDYEKKKTKPSTCREMGILTFTCKKCGDIRTEKISLAAHSYDGGVTEKQSTCKEYGKKKYKCSACGDIKIEPMGLLDHIWNMEYQDVPGVSKRHGKRKTA